MTTRVEIPETFRKSLTRLERRFPRVINEVDKLIDLLEQDERPGDKIPGVGYDVYKVRLKNPSAKKGKRGGFRLIYYIQLADQIVLLTIYSKSEQSDISAKQLQLIIEDYIAATRTEGDE